MEKQRRKIRKIFWIVLIAGSSVLGGLKGVLGLEGTEAHLLTGSWLAFLFIASIWIDLHWHRKMQKKLAEALKILLEEKDPDRYMEELHKLFEGVKRRNLLVSYYVNLSVAYAEKKEYEKALDCLEKIESDRLRGQFKAAYWANRSLFCFHLGKGEEGRDILQKQGMLLSKYKEHPYAAETLDILPVLEQMSLSEWEKAEELLAEVRNKWQNADDLEYFDGLAEICRKGREGGMECQSQLG